MITTKEIGGKSSDTVALPLGKSDTGNGFGTTRFGADGELSSKRDEDVSTNPLTTRNIRDVPPISSMETAAATVAFVGLTTLTDSCMPSADLDAWASKANGIRKAGGVGGSAERTEGGPHTFACTAVWLIEKYGPVGVAAVGATDRCSSQLAFSPTPLLRSGKLFSAPWLNQVSRQRKQRHSPR